MVKARAGLLEILFEFDTKKAKKDLKNENYFDKLFWICNL